MPKPAAGKASARPAPKASKRARRDPAQARQLILDAATRVIAAHGPNAVGIKEVAAEAGVSNALITHYFGTYEALVSAAVTNAMTTLRTRLIERILATPDPSPEKVVLTYLDIALEPTYGRLVSWTLLADHDGSASYAHLMEPDMKLIAAATEYMLGSRMKPAPTRRQTEALLVSVWSLVVGYVAGRGFYWRALGRKANPQRDGDLREAVTALTRAMFG